MQIDAKKMRPSALCQLLNSTPLGEVINTAKLRRHRERGGLRFGGDRHVDLYRYFAWLFQERHFPKQPPVSTISAETPVSPDFADVLVSAELTLHQQKLKGHGQKFGAKAAAAIAAMITEPTYLKAAAKAGISKATLHRWLKLPEFAEAFHRTRRAIVESAYGKMQAMSGLLVDSVLNVALNARRDSDRARASLALLDRASRGLPSANALCVSGGDESTAWKSKSVLLLESVLREVEKSDLSLAEKARFIPTLTEALHRAQNQEELVRRIEAMEAVARSKEEKAP